LTICPPSDLISANSLKSLIASASRPCSPNNPSANAPPIAEPLPRFREKHRISLQKDTGRAYIRVLAQPGNSPFPDLPGRFDGETISLLWRNMNVGCCEVTRTSETQSVATTLRGGEPGTTRRSSRLRTRCK